MSRIAIKVTEEDQRHIRKHMNPHGLPFAQVLANIVHEVARDDRHSHLMEEAAKRVASARAKLMARL